MDEHECCECGWGPCDCEHDEDGCTMCSDCVDEQTDEGDDDQEDEDDVDDE